MQFCYKGSTTPLLVLDRGEGNARATRVLGGKEDFKVTLIPFHTLKGNVKGTGPFRSGISWAPADSEMRAPGAKRRLGGAPAQNGWRSYPLVSR